MDEMSCYVWQEQQRQNGEFISQQHQQQHNHNHNLFVSTSSWSSSGSVLVDDDNNSEFNFCPVPAALSNANDEDVSTNTSSSSSIENENGRSSSGGSGGIDDVNSNSQMMVELTTAAEQTRPPPTNPNIQLWQYLLECLEDKCLSHIIRWTNTTISASSTPASGCGGGGAHSRSRTATGGDNANEFVIIDARELAKRWARIKRHREYQRDNHINLHGSDDFDIVDDESSRGDCSHCSDLDEVACLQRFNRILRYYLNKKHLLHKLVGGKPNTYVFLTDIQPYLRMIRRNRRENMLA